MSKCQHKTGCSKAAEYTTTATLNGDTHCRVLCFQHAHDALAGNGMRFIDERVQAQHGRLRRAAEHSRMVPGGWRRPPRHVQYDTLRVAVAADATLTEGDEVTVRAETVHGFGRTLVWGVAKVTRELGKVRTAPNGHAYRFAYVQLPRDWNTTYASVSTHYIMN